MKTFFTADLHFECPRLVENTRLAWTTVEDHDQLLIDNINEDVGRSDRLMILGDFCGPKASAEKWRQKIVCRNIWIILGNHDKRGKMERAFGNGRVRDTMLLKLGTQEDRRLVWCSHYPHCHWPHSHYGSYHIYGHTHSQKEDELNHMMPDRRSMDVGVDNIWQMSGDARVIQDCELFALLSFRFGHGIIDKKDRWSERDYAEVD